MGKFSVTSKERKSLNLDKTLIAEKSLVNQTSPIEAPKMPVAKTSQKVSTLMNEVLNARNYIVEELSATFEKKLEKMDEAIVDLISSRTENERLKAKIDNLTRENYRLKKEIESFKSVVPGVYIKSKKDTINL